MPPQILYAGSTAWEWIGRKPPAAQKDAIAALEFAAPVRLTAIDAYLAIIPQTTATALTANTHCTSAHVILVVGGLAAAFGRNTNSQCGFVGTSRGEPTAILVDHEKWVAAATGRAHSVVVSGMYSVNVIFTPRLSPPDHLNHAPIAPETVFIFFESIIVFG